MFLENIHRPKSPLQMYTGFHASTKPEQEESMKRARTDRVLSHLHAGCKTPRVFPDIGKEKVVWPVAVFDGFWSLLMSFPELTQAVEVYLLDHSNTEFA